MEKQSRIAGPSTLPGIEMEERHIRRLFAAILCRAAEDYLSPKLSSGCSLKTIGRDAEYWFFKDNRTHIFSLDSICRYLGFNIDRIRNEIKDLKMRWIMIQSRRKKDKLGHRIINYFAQIDEDGGDGSYLDHPVSPLIKHGKLWPRLD